MISSPEPLVSVCVVTYQHGDFIEPALRSALAQGYRPLEIVVADDGSTDGTYERALALARAHPDVMTVLEQRPNSGLAGIVENCNRALRACRGKYVVLLQGDDLFLPGKLSAQVAWLEADPRRVMCGHDVDVFESVSGASLHRWGSRFGLPEGVGARWIIENGVPFCTVSVMVRRSAIAAEGFDARLRVVLDWKFWIDCLGHEGVFGSVPGVLARYRRHAGGVSAKFRAVGQDDLFTTLALVESRDVRWARSCARGRARLHYMVGLDRFAAEPTTTGPARRRLYEAARLEPFTHWRAGVALLASVVAPQWLRRRVGGALNPPGDAVRTARVSR